MMKKLFVSAAVAALFLTGCSGSDKGDEAAGDQPAETADKPADKPAAPPASDNKFATEAAAQINEGNVDAEADKLEKELMAELGE
jgi:PBP1b-binding outer membrane lipoprotein LpoB